MPTTIEEAQRTLLTAQHYIDLHKVMSTADRISPRYKKAEHRMALHRRAFQILSKADLITDEYLNSFSDCENWY